MQSQKDKKAGDDEILRIARERFNQAEEAEQNIRSEALEDLKFADGEQWEDDVKLARKHDGRPCFTINRMPQFIRQVTNDQRQNRPAIKISPVDDAADIETAKIYQGIIRHIENSSDADTAYDVAFDRAARSSFGFFRIRTEYCDPNSFDQEIRIEQIPDQFCTYLDPNYKRPDGSDAEWGFIFETMKSENYKVAYPDSELASMDDWQSVGDTTPGWAEKGGCRIAEYFFKEYEDVTLVLLSDKSVFNKPDYEAMLGAGLVPPDVQVVSERKSRVPTVKWYKINAVEVLEKTDWPGKWIPIIPVLGEMVIIDGEKRLSSVIRHARDAQRLVNYWKSSEAETISLNTKAPFIGYAGQFEGFENDWKTANTRNHAFLQVKAISIGGQPAPLPQRNAFEPPVQAITQAGLYAAEDLKATTGIYDGALGARSNETSGIAIQRRNVQSQTSNFHFIDNLSKSIRHCGRQLVDLIPKVYDTDRAVRILGEDGSEEVIRLNQEFERDGHGLVSYQLGVGKYDVSVNTGPSFETKRQEAVASMADMSRAYPQLMGVAGDLMVKNMDWPGAQDIAERLKKTLPPGIGDDPKNMQIPPPVKAQMDHQMQMIDQLTNQLNEANEKIQNKSIELDSKERIEMAKLETQATIELAKLESNEALKLLTHQIAELDQRQKQLESIQYFENEQDAGSEMGQPSYEEQQQQPTDGFSSGEFTGV